MKAASGFLWAWAIAATAAAPARSAYIIHLYNPWVTDATRPSPPAFIQIQGKDPGYYPGTRMTAEAGDWYAYAFLEAAPAKNDKFHFVDYLPAGGNIYAGGLTFDNSGMDFTMGEVFLTPGVTEAWIIPQGPGKPPLVTSIPPVAKVVYLFNPWPETAPAIRISGDTSAVAMRASPDPARCGWYVHYLTGPGRAVAFSARVGTENFGRDGLGSAASIDLAAAFATSDTLYIQPVPGGPPALLRAFPAGTVGTCAFPLAVTIRDFSAKHPDFEKDGMEGALTKGMVSPVLPPDKKPTQGPKSFFQSHFDHWFRTDSNNADPALRNYETCRDLSFKKDAGGYWGHDSYDDADHSYFPIDDFNRFGETYMSHYRDRETGKWVDGKQHNFHFCMEMHAGFRYRQGQVFRFSGDDDVWVYIDNKLAIDIGGTHGPESDSVHVDALGLVPGNKYDFDLYFCERKTQGSNLLIQTSIFFEQNQSLWARKSLEGKRERYDLFEILSGDKSCGAAPDGDTVAARAGFKLSGPGLDPARDLPAGVSFGGITIDTGKARVSIDTAAMQGLAPGLYTVTYTSLRSGKGGTILFTVNAPPIPPIPPAPPLSATGAWVQDRDGDGRLETAIVTFSGPLPALPARLEFAFADGAIAGSSAATAPASIAAVPGAPNRAQVTFPVPLPFGLTSFAAAPPPGRAFAQADIPLRDTLFAVADSAAPVIISAEVREPDSTQPLKRLLITLSEPATIDPAAPEPLAFRGEAVAVGQGRAFPLGAVRIARMEKIGDRRYQFLLDSGSAVLPVAGDSVALSLDGSARDAYGNTPVHPQFRRLEGRPPAPGPLDVYVTFPNGTRDAPASGSPNVSPRLPPGAVPAFIPVGREGAPLPGPGRCSGCAAFRDGRFAGPVFQLQVPGPTAYAFRIFTNTGAFVARGQGRVEAEDLDALEKRGGPGGVRYLARIVWTGRAESGGQAGTGVYVLTALLLSDRDARTGAPPRAETRKIRFGLLRGVD